MKEKGERNINKYLRSNAGVSSTCGAKRTNIASAGIFWCGIVSYENFMRTLSSPYWSFSHCAPSLLSSYALTFSYLPYTRKQLLMWRQLTRQYLWVKDIESIHKIWSKFTSF
jgi:hypothetical protein